MTVSFRRRRRAGEFQPPPPPPPRPSPSSARTFPLPPFPTSESGFSVRHGPGPASLAVSSVSRPPPGPTHQAAPAGGRRLTAFAQSPCKPEVLTFQACRDRPDGARRRPDPGHGLRADPAAAATTGPPTAGFESEQPPPQAAPAASWADDG